MMRAASTSPATLGLWVVLGLASPVGADSLIAARAIVGNTIVSEADIRFARGDIEGAVSDPASVVGREAKVTIYAGRPIRAGDFRAPALIERNDIVRLRYRHGGLIIEADARALDRGAAGERISVMNLTSRTRLSGVVRKSGHVEVSR